ncbi:hypothetical protein TNCT_516961 [Trichonephila clavata]|uniref:Uncharacterized protein n=1 Tax=Trichonephila clavata TaxID=2740835 RepID=A0A8X6HTW6_TRICU|nr:hypothetical protein TNCT_516961 [Trichonephila clavata]
MKKSAEFPTPHKLEIPRILSFLSFSHSYLFTSQVKVLTLFPLHLKTAYHISHHGLQVGARKSKSVEAVLNNLSRCFGGHKLEKTAVK